MAKKPTRPKIGIKVHYSEQKLVLHTETDKKCVIKPLLANGSRFEFEYMHTLILFRWDSLIYEAYDRMGRELPDYALPGDVRELFHSFSQIMMLVIRAGYKSAPKGFETPFTAQMHMFDEVPRR